MSQLSAVIITFNEEQFIEKCLLSLKKVADEIIVVDSYSTDNTEQICRKHNVRFIKHDFEGYVEQKNFALTQATYPHIISLDADEALSDQAVESILKVKQNFDHAGYIFNRSNNYCGRWLKYSRSYPDKQLRLFDSRKGKWMGPNPHDRFILDKRNKSIKIKGDILHWNFESYEEHIDKMNKFSTIAALEAFKAGKKSGPLTALMHFTWSFFRSYFLYRGLLDGYDGFMSCSISAFTSFMKYAKLRSLIKNNK